MKFRNLKLNLVLFTGLGFTNLQAQQAVPASGSNASGSGGSASYSVGQLVFSYKTGTTGFMTEGIQQPFEVQVITGIDNARDIALSFSAYPNPTINYLTLKANNIDLTDLHYQLYNLNGQLLNEQAVTSKESSISMLNYAPAIYYLKVLDSQEVVKTFKIIKN